MRIKILSIVILLLFSISGFSQINESNVTEIQKNLAFLSDDNLKGRASGTKEDEVAAEYIATKLSEYGYKPLFGESPLVPFEFIQYRETGFGSKLIVTGLTLLENVEYSVPPISACAEINGKLSYIGKGDTGNDLKGKIVVIESSLDSIPFKVTALSDKGAVGILFFSMDTLNLARKISSSGTSLPIAQISRETAQRLSASEGSDVYYKSVVNIVKGKSFNIAMKLGSGDVKGAILIGAHYDHIGMGGQGSGSMVPKISAIHNGADDNASGVASILETSRILALKAKELKHNIIIVAFGGEERGLLGSKIIADTLKKLNLMPVLMLNLDMVGRLANDKLQVGGIGTFSQADSIVRWVNKDFNFNISFTQDGYGPSDHSSFYTNDVPVLYFTTGIHKQYHTPSDDIDLINFPGMVSVTNFISTIALNVATSSETPTYKKISVSQSPGRASFKVTLGLIPDFTYEVGDGFKAGSVTDGKPAQTGGMLTGDLITAINSKKVSNIYDYMARLGELKLGDIIIVYVRRDGKDIKLTIQL